MKVSRIAAVLCCFIALFSLNAQDSMPDWLRMEQGERQFENGELGDALRTFRAVLADDPTAPEPHYWIGRVFEEEGELDLAEIQYSKAIDFSRQLYVMEQELEIRERLARLYKIRGDYALFEQELLTIVARNEDFSSPEGIAQQAAMTRIVMTQGLDKVVELYRIDASETFLANAELGLFYYRTGRYRDALLHLLLSTLTVVTRTIEYQQVERPFYEYTDVENLLELAVEDRHNAAYLAASHADALFYYLGAALYAVGEPTRSMELMGIVRDSFPGTPWRSRAIAQLADPYIEPVITSEEFFYFF